MKGKIAKIFAKFIMVMLMIASMLSSSIIPIISYAVENLEQDKVTESEYIGFNLNWKDVSNEISVQDGNVTVAEFELSFNTISKFQNFRIEVEKSDLLKLEFKNSGEYFGESSNANQIQYLKDIPGGTKISGNINLTFAKAIDFQDYTQDVKVKLIGTYELDGEEVEVEITRNISATVSSKAVVNPHNLEISYELTNNRTETSSNTSQLYIVNKIIENYELNVDCKNSEYTNIELDFYRTSNNKTYYPDEVTFQNIEDFKLSTVETNGKISKRILEKGESHNEYVQDSEFNINKTIKIHVEYNIEDARTDLITSTRANARVKSEGYTFTTDKTGTSNEKTQLYKDKSVAEDYGLHRETTGKDAWGTCYMGTGGNGYAYNQDNLNEFIKNDTMELSFSTSFHYVDGIENAGDTTVTQYRGQIAYFNEDTYGNITKTLNNEEMYVKKIKCYGIGPNGCIRFYDSATKQLFFTATPDNKEYVADESTKIGEYYAVASDAIVNYYQGWTTTYEMCASKLKQNGLTEKQILNIREIYKGHNVAGYHMYRDNQGASYFITGYEKQDLSHFNTENNNINANVSETSSEVEDKLTLYMNVRGMDGGTYRNVTVKNTNPTFYISLPNEFDFKISNIQLKNAKDMMYVDNWKIKKVNGNNILQVMCKGTSNSSKNADVSLEINYVRTLKQNITTTSGTVEVYMKTDEDKYYSSRADSFDYDEDGEISDKLAYSSFDYSIEYNKQIQLSNYVYNALGEERKDEDIVLQKGNTVKYKTVLSNQSEDIKDINIISRLPFEGNKTIIGNRDLGTNTTLSNVKKIKIYTQSQGGSEIELPQDNYEIKYSAEAEANFDTEYTENIENAKTLQIKFKDTYVLNVNNNLIVEYECDIPEDVEEGKTAMQTSAVKYRNTSNAEKDPIEPAKSRVIVGDNSGTVEIIKSFQGERNTENLENIEFKIVKIDDQSKSYTGKTDANGHVIFKNIPVGEWEITETSQNENYKPESSKYIKISNKEQYTEEQGKAINIENKVKMSKLEIIKQWEDTNDIQEETIKFEITGTAVNGESKTITDVTTYTKKDENGDNISIAECYVPYGNYTIKETSGKYGWYAEDVNVEAKAEIVKVNMVNKITKGILQIEKTVPEGETAEGLTFRITGIGDVSYTNKEGKEIILKIDKTVSTQETNEQVQISEDKRKATINVPDMPVGTYKIEEINIPKINTESGETTKYINVSKHVTIPDKNGETTISQIENKYKTGNIKIQVTVDEGIDIENFKVKVSGTSYHGKYYEEIFNVPTSGIITVKGLEIGKYKVEEVDTKEKDGKIYTTSPDGFEVTYNPENANTGSEVQYRKTTKVEIHNKYVGKGRVKIRKTLEAEEDKSKASGIQFKIVGKDLAGKDVNETITIGEDGTGLSNEIPVGTYLLSEIEETVPEIYEIAEDQEITITTENTQEKPLELQIENKLINSKKIIMETELEEGGVPETPVNYTVTKVDNNLNKLEEPIEVQGDKKSHAELDGLKGGRYIVEQKDIPEGYIKDTRQVLDVTRYGTGYALFILQKEQNITETETTKVIIEKEIQNEEGNIATQEDYEKAKINLKDKYSFEVKLQNLDTKETFYTFIDEKNKDTIEGLPHGTYEIEEIYKPKFKMLKIEGEQIQKNEETGKYTFTLQENQKTINIKIKNQINTDFGFGGQDTKDNLSKVLQEKIEEVVITKARIYVRDDEGNKISEATFKIYDTQGNLIKFAGGNGTFIPSEEGNETIKPYNGNITIKGLPVGNYKLINETVDDKYLKSTDKTITIYKDAVGITRIELLRNIPRGNLRLSTTYQTASGEQKYAPRSKYKILNPETEEILTFTKKADGTYQRSSLPNATEDISLRAGYVDVTGIEAGIDYQIGIVDLTEKYGVIKEELETVVIEEGVQKEVSVSVEERGQRFQKALWVDSSFFIALDIEGKIWSSDRYSNYGKLYNQLTCVNDYSENEIIKNVRFKEINILNPSQIYLIDEEGKIWTMSGACRNLKCISDIDGSLMKNVKIEKIGISSSNSYALDKKGKVWRFMQISVNADIDVGITPTKDPICISEKGNLKNVVITDIKTNGSSVIALDNTGKVWTWGMNLNYQCGTDNNGEKIEPTCISDLEGSNIHDLKIEKIEMGNGYSYLIDTQHRLWTFGHKNWKSEDTEEKYFWNPICINENNNETELNGIGVINIEISKNIAHQQFIKVIDEEGKLWAWIDSPNSSTLETAMCISDRSDFELDNVEIVQASIIYNKGIAIDKQGSIWMWGQGGGINLVANWNNQGPKSGIMVNPTKYNPQKKSYFSINKFVKVYAGYYNSVAIDESGRVWTWGANKADNGYSNNLGIGSEEDFVTTTPVCVGGGNSQISKEKIVDVALNSWITVALDDDGKVWFWGHGRGWIQKVHDPVCISTLNYDWNGLFGKKIKQIKCNLGNHHYKGSYSEKIAAIDTDGKIYMIDLSSISGIDNGAENDKYEYLADIEFVKIQSGAANFMALDSKGKVWVWKINEKGFDEPYCLNEQEETLNEIKIKEMSIGGGPNSMGESNGESKFFIDENNDLWVLGNNSYGELGTVGYVNKIKCITQDETNTLYGKKIIKAVVGGNIGEIGFSDRETDLISLVVDSEGKIWTCGGRNYRNDTNVARFKCINEDIDLDPADISIGNNYCLAVDKSGNIWSWGNNKYAATGKTEDYSDKPQKLIGETYKYNPEYGKKYENVSEYALISENVKYGNDGQMGIKQKKSYRDIVTMEIDCEGNLWSYGLNNKYAILGEGTQDSRQEPKCINYKFNNKIDEIVYLSDTNAVIKDVEGKIWTWGYNGNGQCGTGSTADVLEPTCINADKFTAKDIKFINGTIIVQDTEGKIWTWGSNSNGQCGTGNTANVLEPTCVSEGKFTAKDIKFNSYSGLTMIVQDTEGRIWTWGSNQYGKCGTGSTGNVLEPTWINSGKFIVKEIKVEVSSPIVTIEDTEGRTWTWGGYYNIPICINGDANNSENTDRNVKTYNMFGNTFNIKKDEEGKVWTWGYNEYGLCGTGNTDSVPEPVCISENKFTVNDIEDIQFISYGNSAPVATIIVQDTEGKIWTWGNNYSGQCGIDDQDSTMPVILEPTCISTNKFIAKDIQYIVNGTEATAIVRDTEGKIWMWGSNATGQCGTGNTNNVLEPICIDVNKFTTNEIRIIPYCFNGVVKIEGTDGNQYEYPMPRIGATVIVQDTEGKIWTWGYNGNGQCGTGNTENVLEPTCINTDKFTVKDMKIIPYNYTETVNGSSYPMPKIGVTVILQDTEGKIWTWGYNGNGQCGTGNTNNVLEPTCINEDNKFKAQEILQADDTIIVKDIEEKNWTWGKIKYENYGRTILSPTSEEFKIEKVIRSDSTAILQDTEGRIWTCGENQYGQCGTGNKENVSELTCINEENKFKVEKIIRSDNTIILQDTEGKIWAWGENTKGQCGTGNKQEVLTPTCISDIYAMDFKGTTLKVITTNSQEAFILAIDKDKEAWLCKAGSEPIKLNSLDKINNKKIKEVALINTGTESDIPKLAILTTNGFLYITDYNLQTVECLGEQETIGSYGKGPWKKEFILLKDSKY